MTLGNRIYDFRKKAGLTRDDVAQKCSVSSQSVQKWESDHAKPSVDNLIILSQILNVSLDELLTGCTERVRDEKRRAGVRPDYPSLHPWELYSEELMVEFRQSREEGIDIDEYEELFKAVSHLPGGEYKERIADVMFDIVSRTPLKKDYEFDEPSELDEIKMCRGTVPEKRSVDKSRLRDKIAGAWYGRICGCFLGKPVEGVRNPELGILLRETENYPMHRYIKRSDLSDELLGRVGSWLGKNMYADISECAPADDDTNYTVLYQELIEKYGRDFTSKNVADIWLDRQPKNAYCTAERAAFCNFVKGFAPPASAEYKNPYREWIGAQIRGDYFGYINPGDPETAADMAYRDACVSHTKNGIYGEMFISALISEAAVENDIRKAILSSLNFVPQRSRFIRSVMTVVNDFDGGVSENECFSKIHSRWDEHEGHDWCHVLSNIEIVTAALLYGGGDYTKTVCRAVQTGFDTDCNAATAGSVIGMMKGISAVGREWTDPIHGKLDTQIFGVGKVNIDDRIELTLKHIEK